MPDILERLLSAISATDDAVSRLDERVRACTFAAGWAARQDIAEAVAWSWNAGAPISAEELILHDEGMDVRLPNDMVRAAHGFLRGRRKTRVGGADMVSVAGAAWLSGRAKTPPSPPPPTAPRLGSALAADAPLWPQLLDELTRLQTGVTEAPQAAVADWLRLLEIEDLRCPPVLQAAVALEGWRIVEPYPREPYVGALIVGAWLTARARVRSGLFGVEAGYRDIMRRARPSAALPPAERILFWLAVLRAAADLGGEALNRLELARQVAKGRVGTRRGHSHLEALLTLLLARPVVTAPLVAERLGITPQSARRLLTELGGSVTEISGQSRFRAWRLG